MPSLPVNGTPTMVLAFNGIPTVVESSVGTLTVGLVMCDFMAFIRCIEDIVLDISGLTRRSGRFRGRQ